MKVRIIDGSSENYDSVLLPSTRVDISAVWLNNAEAQKTRSDYP
jgi:hypothetical protein